MDPATFDLSHFNWLGFGLSILVFMVLGFIWYAPWFPTGRVWVRASKMDMSQKIPARQMAMSMGMMVIGAVLLMFVYAHNMMVYEDAFRNVATGGKAGYKLTAMDGITGGFFTWLGFIVPLNLNAVAFDRKPWSLFGVNAGYYLVSLVVAGILIATVGAQ